jgi:hypothetical protein
MGFFIDMTLDILSIRKISRIFDDIKKTENQGKSNEAMGGFRGIIVQYRCFGR